MDHLIKITLWSTVACCGISAPVQAQSFGELLWRVSQYSEQKAGDTPNQKVEKTPTPRFDGKDRNPFPVNKEPVKAQAIQVVEPVRSKVDYRQIEANKVLKDIRTYMARNQVLLPNVEDIVVEGFLQGAHGAQALINGSWRVKGDQITVTSSKHQKFSMLVDRLSELSPALMESLNQDLQGLEEQSNAFLLEIMAIQPNVIVLEDGREEQYNLKF